MTDQAPDRAGPEEEDDLLEKLASVNAMFADIRLQLEALRKELLAGGDGAGEDAAKRLVTVRNALTVCLKLEVDVEKLRDERRGYVEGRRPLDLGRARAEIRGALDRLRR